MIFKNLGAVPGTDVPDGNSYWNRGFLALLLDQSGDPTHVCKIRPEGEPGTRHESQILRRLSTDPDVSFLIPPSRWSALSGVQMLATAYLPGQPYSDRLGKRSGDEWSADMSEVLALANRLSDRAARLFPKLLDGVGKGSLLESAGPALASLGHLGIAPRQVTALSGCLAAAAVPTAVLQHGDLWPANLIFQDGHWQFLDFEAFGTIRVPLFDAFHLLRTCMEQRAGGSGSAPWVTQLTSETKEAVSCRALLAEAAARENVGRSLRTPCLVYYLVAFLYRCYRVHLPPALIEPMVLEVKALADLLEREPQALTRYLCAP